MRKFLLVIIVFFVLSKFSSLFCFIIFLLLIDFVYSGGMKEIILVGVILINNLVVF